MGTNMYFMLRRMIIFYTFMVHIGKTRMKPSFFGFYWLKKEQNRDKKGTNKKKNYLKFNVFALYFG